MEAFFLICICTVMTMVGLRGQSKASILEDCYASDVLHSYMGFIHHSKSGLLCHTWVNIFYQPNKYFPKNYCRSSTFGEQPYCFVGINPHRENCAVSPCMNVAATLQPDMSRGHNGSAMTDLDIKTHYSVSSRAGKEPPISLIVDVSGGIGGSDRPVQVEVFLLATVSGGKMRLSAMQLPHIQSSIRNSEHPYYHESVCTRQPKQANVQNYGAGSQTGYQHFVCSQHAHWLRINVSAFSQTSIVLLSVSDLRVYIVPNDKCAWRRDRADYFNYFNFHCDSTRKQILLEPNARNLMTNVKKDLNSENYCIPYYQNASYFINLCKVKDYFVECDLSPNCKTTACYLPVMDSFSFPVDSATTADGLRQCQVWHGILNNSNYQNMFPKVRFALANDSRRFHNLCLNVVSLEPKCFVLSHNLHPRLVSCGIVLCGQCQNHLTVVREIEN